ncbi:hypothetical protein CGLO_03940 [Colletotrichum gloeosporioides Cg-14]|uniref:Uncharacterized protein n=1 Tax=Colletotrichum gloeosporioides (strain Cg-14) TaxID=1237896 RepID=T0LWM4_COLGC|nr:hypothetical protein CGLO_03940 [Colletotrichum gloeosporioides Cg-14]
MKPRPSNSGSGAIPPPNPSLQQQSQQQPNLNPSARSFTPVAIMPPVAPSAYSPPVQHQVELVYHQAKAAEAAKMMAARAHAHTPPTSGSDQMHVPKKRRISNALGGPFDKQPSRSASAPNAAGVAVDHHGIPKTPPNRSIQPQRTTPTPPAYTFDDDDIFFPNADKPLVKSVRGKKKAPSGRK